MNLPKSFVGYLQIQQRVVIKGGNKDFSKVASKKLIFILKLSLTAGLFIVIFSLIDVEEILSPLSGARYEMLVLAIVILALQPVVGAFRWLCILDGMAISFKWITAYTAILIGFFFSHVLPSTVGGDIFRIYVGHKGGLPLRKTITSVLIERIASVLALVLLVAIASPFSKMGVEGLVPIWVMWLVLAAVAIGIWASHFLMKIPEAKRTMRIVQWLCHMAEDVYLIYRSPLDGAKIMFWSFVGLINISVAVYILALSIGLENQVTLTVCLVLVPPVILIATIPLSIAGWGIREGAMIVAFGFVGVSNANAVLLSLIFGSVDLISCLPGGVLWLLRKYAPKDASNLFQGNKK